MFVDPFLNPLLNKYKARDFNAYLDRLALNEHQPVIEVHTSIKVMESEAGFEKTEVELRRWFRARHLKGYLYIWNPRAKSKGMHDRYLLTDIGGCQLGAGFEGARNQAQTMTVLDSALRRELMDIFDPSPNLATGLEHCAALE